MFCLFAFRCFPVGWRLCPEGLFLAQGTPAAGGHMDSRQAACWREAGWEFRVSIDNPRCGSHGWVPGRLLLSPRGVSLIPLSPPGPRNHTHTLSSNPFPELQTLPSPCVLTNSSFVTVTDTELLELPVNLAFFLSSQALGMAPQIPQPEPQEAP